MGDRCPAELRNSPEYSLPGYASFGQPNSEDQHGGWNDDHESFQHLADMLHVDIVIWVSSALDLDPNSYVVCVAGGHSRMGVKVTQLNTMMHDCHRARPLVHVVWQHHHFHCMRRALAEGHPNYQLPAWLHKRVASWVQTPGVRTLYIPSVLDLSGQIQLHAIDGTQQASPQKRRAQIPGSISPQGRKKRRASPTGQTESGTLWEAAPASQLSTIMKWTKDVIRWLLENRYTVAIDSGKTPTKAVLARQLDECMIIETQREKKQQGDHAVTSVQEKPNQRLELLLSFATQLENALGHISTGARSQRTGTCASSEMDNDERALCVMILEGLGTPTYNAFNTHYLEACRLLVTPAPHEEPVQDLRQLNSRMTALQTAMSYRTKPQRSACSLTEQQQGQQATNLDYVRRAVAYMQFHSNMWLIPEDTHVHPSKRTKND